MHTLLPRHRLSFICAISITLLTAASGAGADMPEVLGPYTGPSSEGIDTSTLTGKVICGYQGWFNCEGDGADLGWKHWARNGRKPFGPGNATVDLWPDVRELAADELFDTGFRLADGRFAPVFSSYQRETVLRHFRWMQEYGIDGVMVQRFANGLNNEREKQHKDTVLAHCREGAHRSGRGYAVMYDLSGLPAGGTTRVADDWKMLREKMRIDEDRAYWRHGGQPVVAVWGIGFNDNRKYTLDECRNLINALKRAGCAVMVGVPTGWRTLDRDSVRDANLHDVLRRADIISPWTIGRYRSPQEAQRHADQVWKPDIDACRKRKIDYLPTVFPGFSWHNLNGGDLDQIPRLKGEFLWSQFKAAKKAGAKMIYVAMFDEVDEGTAIFKCTNDVPRGDGVIFLTYDDLPSDYYLRLTGMGGKLLRGEIPPTQTVP